MITVTGSSRIRLELTGTGNKEQNARQASRASLMRYSNSLMNRGSVPRETSHEEKLEVRSISSYLYKMSKKALGKGHDVHADPRR